ncbi:lasso peptide [Scytonema tolypothrichoides VB-61278]|nr:lasso peptide [Scytonema tolypothrichoides VB-61278]
MKSSYTAPKLTVHGNVADITQITNGDTRKDFLFLNGTVTSDGNDLGSKDVCLGTTPKGPNCDPKY